MVRFGLENVLGSSCCWNVPLLSSSSKNQKRQERQRHTRLPFRYVTPLIFSRERPRTGTHVSDRVRDRDRRSLIGRRQATTLHIATLGTRNKKMWQPNWRGTNTPYFLYIYMQSGPEDGSHYQHVVVNAAIEVSLSTQCWNQWEYSRWCMHCRTFGTEQCRGLGYRGRRILSRDSHGNVLSIFWKISISVLLATSSYMLAIFIGEQNVDGSYHY